VSQQQTVTVEMFPARPGEAPLVITLTEAMTLDDLVDDLNIPADTEAVIVNNAYEAPDYRLKDGDRVRVIRFTSGG
jgi:sulfur carrier protein ThiS